MNKMPLTKNFPTCKWDNYRYVGVNIDDECDDVFAYEKGTGELYVPAKLTLMMSFPHHCMRMLHRIMMKLVMLMSNVICVRTCRRWKWSPGRNIEEKSNLPPNQPKQRGQILCKLQ